MKVVGAIYQSLFLQHVGGGGSKIICSPPMGLLDSGAELGSLEEGVQRIECCGFPVIVMKGCGGRLC